MYLASLSPSSTHADTTLTVGNALYRLVKPSGHATTFAKIWRVERRDDSGSGNIRDTRTHVTHTHTHTHAHTHTHTHTHAHAHAHACRSS